MTARIRRTLNVVILVVVLTVLGPLGEEFLFRGYIFRALRNWRGVWPAACAVRRDAHRMVAARGGCSSHGVRDHDVPALSLDGIVVSLHRRSHDQQLDRPRGRAALDMAATPADRWLDARGAGDLPADRPPTRRRAPHTTQPERRCASRPRVIEGGPPRPGGQVRGAVRGRARSSSSSPGSRACRRRRRVSTRPRRRGVGSRQARHARRSPGHRRRTIRVGCVRSVSGSERATTAHRKARTTTNGAMKNRAHSRPPSCARAHRVLRSRYRPSCRRSSPIDAVTSPRQYDAREGRRSHEHRRRRHPDTV